MTKGNKSNSNGGSNNSTRNKQREVDLTNRINTLIKTNTETTITVQQYKKQVLEEKKKTIDTKIQMSKLRDEVLGLNEKIQGFYDKERRSHFSTSEKVSLGT